MSMQCKVNSRLTPPEVRSTTPKEEDMEVMEDTKAEEDTEVEEGVEEHLAEDEDQSYVITMDDRVTSHKTVQRLYVPIGKLPIMLLKSAQYC